MAKRPLPLISCWFILAGIVQLAACGGGAETVVIKPAPGEPTPTPTPTPGPTSGLDQRPANSTCRAGDAPTQTTAVQRVFPGLSFTSPVGLLQAPNNATRWFVIEQAGRIKVFANNASVATATNFVDISGRVASGGETGLLGMAFHPNFPANPRVYLSYTAGPSPLVSRISEFRSADGGATLDASSEVILLTVNQPESNHNGGHIAFGPDGYLYIGLGDGGGGGDQHGAIGNGQNLQTLLGKLLRIDVNGTTGAVKYAIPSNNPFVGNALCGAGGSGAQSCAEIYAYGLRNPWRFSFDRANGDLWLGDVGQNTWEEIDKIARGGNYGWRCREGAHDFSANACGGGTGSIDPIAEYDHSAGQSVTGGFVYRGSALPGLVGRYVFGDFGSGRIWDIANNAASTQRVTTGLSSGLSISSFAQSSDGEIFVVNYQGTLHQLVAGAAGGGSVATQLSATGCVAATNATLPAGGLIPYTPNVSFWSDGAQKQRWFALPDGQNIAVGSDGDWDFPNGSVLVKNFKLGSTLVETRLFMRHNDGNWAGYTYEWNSAGTDATRVIGGKTTTVNGQTWIFPSEAQCLTCHTTAAGRGLGLETAQLNRDLLYPTTGRTANQVVTLNSIGTLSPPITQSAASLPSLPDPYGSAGTIAERARAYLATNCSHCHRSGGGTPSNLDLRYATALAATNACNADPQSGALGIANARIIAAGDAARSVLVARMNRRDSNAMPPIGTASVDQAGVTLLTQWVNSLTSCN